MDIRRELIQNVMVVGGNSMTHQFVERLQKEMSDCNMYGMQQRYHFYYIFLDVEHIPHPISKKDCILVGQEAVQWVQ